MKKSTLWELASLRSTTCAVAVLALTACGAGGPGPESVRGIDIAEQTAAVNLKHRGHQTLSVPLMQRHHPANLGAPSSAYPSTVRKHGRVIDIVQAWPTGSAETLVTYVAYGFLSPDFYKSGQIPSTGASTTEIWRYSAGGGGTWCPIITSGLDIAVGGIQALPVVNDPLTSTVDIRMITGSADGVVGKIEFRDSNPLASSCDKVSAEVQFIPGKTNFYTVIQAAESIGSVEKFKLVSVDEGNIPAASKKFEGYQFLYSWGSPACAGAWAIDKSGVCQTFGVSPLRSLLLKNGEPVQTATRIFQDPRGNRGSYFEVNTVADFDARVRSNAAGGLDFAYAIGFTDTTTDSTHSDRLRFGKTSVNSLLDTIKEPAWIDSLDIPLMNIRALPQQVVVSPTMDMVYVSYHGLTSFDKAQIACDYAAKTCKTLSPLTNNPAFPGHETQFAVIRPDARQETTTVLFESRDYVFRTMPFFGNVPIPVIENQALSTNAANPNQIKSAVEMQLDLNVLFQYKAGDPNTQYSSITGMAIGQFEVFSVYDPVKKSRNVHQIFRFNDYGGFDQDGTQHQDTHGGIGYCVSPVNADGSLSLSSCKSPRLNRADGYGFSSAMASQIAKGGSYLTSPSKIRYSISPRGIVSITYVSKAGAISTINASETSTDWTGANAWVTISGGQVAECNALLIKPTQPNPIPPDNFWDSLKSKTIKATASFVVKNALKVTAGPEVSFVAGLGIDYLFSTGERDALQKKQTDQYDAWTKVYDAIQLQTACSVK